MTIVGRDFIKIGDFKHKVGKWIEFKQSLSNKAVYVEWDCPKGDRCHYTEYYDFKIEEGFPLVCPS